MKKVYLILAAAVGMTFTSCTSDEFVGVNGPNAAEAVANDGSIQFGFNLPGRTRANEFVGATAAQKLGNMFVVEGTKGTEETNSPSTTVVFDNYLVGYTANTAGQTESNTHNWEYVGKQTGIASRMTSETWNALHAGGTDAKSQTIKYWDYSTDQYDFIAWSTGERLAVTGDPVANTSVKVTRINKGSGLASNGFTLTAANATDLLQCYYTDINTVLKANYGAPVTLTFRNMAAKVRVALYETVPGYSVKNVRFYTSDANPTAPTDLAYDKETAANLFTMGEDKLPQSGAVTVMYPHIGTTHRGTAPAFTDRTKDYNKASVSVTPGDATATTQAFGAFSNLAAAESNETAGNIYLGRTLPAASFAGAKADDYYTAVIPNTNGKPLTLRVNYTLVSTDGSNEEIKVYGAKAVVPATYTVWQPNYAYTYIFKISDNSNGWTSTTNSDPKGLFPITFDAVVTSFVDANAEQTTVTTVATPSITTYQQGHNHAAKDEYSKSQTAGVSGDVKDLYVQVMNNNGTPTLVTDLNTDGKSLLYKVSKANASEAEVMDALQNRTNTWDATDPIGRNGITLTKDATHLSNTETQIVNGVDDQPITKVGATTIVAGMVAKIDIDNLASTGTYAYVYCTTIPSADEKVYHVAADAVDEASVKNKYYDVDPSTIVAETSLDDKAVAGKVYFVKNVDANGDFVSWTFKQTKVGDSVTGLFEASIPGSKTLTYTAGHFYFDVYNQNNGAYAVKVIKVVG